MEVTRARIRLDSNIPRDREKVGLSALALAKVDMLGIWREKGDHHGYAGRLRFSKLVVARFYTRNH